MLARRLSSAAVIITLMLLILYGDFYLGQETSLGRPGILLSLLSLMTAVLAAGELADMFENAASRINRLGLMVASVLMVAITCAPVLWQDYPPDCALGRFGFALSGLVAGLVFLFFSEMSQFDVDQNKGRGEVIDRLGRGALSLVYLMMLFGFLLNHRFLENDNRLGLLAIVCMITTVKLSDSAAYFTGKALGTIKLAPKLSPGKTIQGSIGGLIGGCVGTAMVVYIVAPAVFGISVDKPWWWILLYGVLVTLAGMVGDLAESLIKRDTNTKDSSRWLPGLGGILDVVDSLVFAAPVSYLLWI